MTDEVRIGNYLCINRYDDVRFDYINLKDDDVFGSGKATCSMYIKDELTGVEATIEFPCDFDINVKWVPEYGNKNEDLVIDEITLTKFYVDIYDINLDNSIRKCSRELGLHKIEMETLFDSAYRKLTDSFIYGVNRKLYMEF